MQSNQDRLLIIKHLLFTKTDTERALSIQDLIEKLRDIFPTMKLDPRTIRKDLEALSNNGFSITERKGKFGRIMYSHEERLFKPYELRYLIDAILEARFISTPHKRRLINCLVSLSGKSYHGVLKNLQIKSDVKVPFEHKLFDRLETLNRAIEKKQEVRLRRGLLGLDGDLIAETDELEILQPYAIFWFDTYYVVGKQLDTDQIVHYPIYHLDNIRITKLPIPREEFNSFCLQNYIDKHFYLFDGAPLSVEIIFNKELLEEMMMHFPNEKIQHHKEGYLLSGEQRLTTDTVHWLLGLGEKATVVGPNQLTAYMRQKAIEITQKYNL